MVVITTLGDMKELELRYYATEEFHSLRLCTDMAPFDIWSYCTDFNTKQGQKQIGATETLPKIPGNDSFGICLYNTKWKLAC